MDVTSDSSAADATKTGGNPADASEAGTTTDAAVTDPGDSGADAQLDAEAAAIGPALGSASTFAILAGTTVTNTNESFFMGDLGVYPGNAVPGITPEMVTGTIYDGGTVARMAQQDLASAYDELRGMNCPTGSELSGDLGTLTLDAGVYCFPAAASLTGKLVLDANGDPSALFVFQIGGALTAAADADVQVIRGGSGCNVFWQVSSSATIGARSNFAGSILASTSITLSTAVSLDGRALAQTGALTIDTTRVAFTSACP